MLTFLKSRRNLRLILGVTLYLILIGGTYYLVTTVYHGCFDSNPRFVLSEKDLNVEFTNSDFFGTPLVPKKNVRDEVWTSVVMSTNKTSNTNYSLGSMYVDKVNLFSIDFEELLKNIEKSPSVFKASVSVILPDRLTVKINARVPIAFLEYGDGQYVCDQEGVVMERDKMLIKKDALPIIKGLKKRNFRVGSRIGEMESALQLLSLLSKNADQGIKPLVVKVEATDMAVELKMLCTYQPNPLSEERTYVVELPGDKKLPAKVKELIAQLREFQVSPVPTKVNYIRLLFDRQIISGYLSETEIKSMFVGD